ncbi:12399_t:CDS:2 [Entrophospora sp. SA101]|nr:1863_t:CDS:2 [Entrophospora sp. SA101]CAJ0761806.1 20186_t:CDS:2 [Entrophospora sp. SA101]CAJ0766239.1 12399_t:CDS:2 [Entrophospora sp. SA101]CAJ0844130.1 10163_t:CDS:2 [Entrophospora sp. SA101]CAJ0907367.1 13013_t:CDS:2 [Entrophospora sp. SA101]
MTTSQPTESNFQIIDIREYTFSKESLIEAIINGLNKPENVIKTIPTFLLYDDRGLQLFDEITHLKEYYLTNAEIEILKNEADRIVDHIKDNSVVIELGSGSLRKTKLILDSLEKKKKNITYYALDLMEYELKKSLSSLGNYENIKLMGLWGTYEDGIKFIGSLSDNNNCANGYSNGDSNGSSNGNSGDKLSKTILWLGSSLGNSTREDGADFIIRLQNQSMDPGDLFLVGIDRKNDPDKIRIAYDDPKGVTRDFIINGLNHVNTILGQKNFIDPNDFEYDSFYNEIEGRHESHYKSKKDMTLKYNHQQGGEEKEIVISLKKDELIHVEYSYKYDEKDLDQLFHKVRLSHVESWTDTQSQYDLHLLSKPPFYFSHGSDDVSSREFIPTLEEWKELWKSWDTILMSMISSKMLLEKPTDLRNPLIFYLGHVSAFMDIYLSKYHNEKNTEPKNFIEIFKRGLYSNAHSVTPVEWPGIDKVIDFRDKVRKRLVSVYEQVHEGKITMKRSLGRVLSMVFEHEAMHLETVLYMLIQSSSTLQPKGVVIPKWKEASTPAPEPKLTTVPRQTITLGHDNDEYKDDEQYDLCKEFGWYNESPRREVSIESFKIHSRPVTNGEYLEFMRATVNKEYPASWVPIDPSLFDYKVRTLFGPIKMNVAMNWPVMLSQEQAWFKKWHPVDVPNNSDKIQTLGSGWEWTSSEFVKHSGFKPSKLCPGYSANFFDDKHVILGGSWATHPRLTRSTFGNWYQGIYPYGFCTVRLCQV